MADSKLQPLLDAAAKATPGSACISSVKNWMGNYVVAELHAPVTLGEFPKQENARFYFEAHNSIPEIQRLVSLELRLREYVGKLRKELQVAGGDVIHVQRVIADRLESLMEGKP